jgi:hypothetical protein
MDIQPWNSDKVEVKPAPSGGKGMYATGAFRKGEALGAFGGRVISDAQMKRYEAEGRLDDLNLDQAMYIHPGLLMIHEPGTPYYPLCYSNHSCDANAHIEHGVVLVASRDIVPGEEVCWDYRLTDDVGEWTYEFKCGCGSAKCAGYVRIGPGYRDKR